MILVVNLNASLDKCYEMGTLEKGTVMRARTVKNTPGGKGIHVANVLTILGEDCLVTGMLGGKTGEYIENGLAAYHIKSDFSKIAGETRSCLAMITEDGMQTEILEPGPEVSEKEQTDFLEKYAALLDKASLVVCSGSIPRKVPKDFYRVLIEMAREKQKDVFLDTSGELLAHGIAAKPFFIKPNQEEIAALRQLEISSKEDLLQEVRNFLADGIKLVAISLGAKGSIVGYRGAIYEVAVPKITAVNPVGSGDAFVAGMAFSIARGYAIEDAIRMASACGTANALEKESGFVTKSVVEELVKKISVEKIASI